MGNIKYCPQCGNQITNKMNNCPECGFKIRTMKPTEHTNSNKKGKILQTKKKNNNIYWFVVTALVIVVSIFIYNKQSAKSNDVIENQTQVTNSVSYPSTRYDAVYTLASVKDGKIILPLDVVKEKKMVKFDLAGTSEKLPILAYLTEDGKVMTAISMCEPCNSTDFHINGSNLICNSCGTTWNLNTLDPISGGCSKYPPDPIPNKVVGKEIQIEEKFVNNWKRRV